MSVAMPQMFGNLTVKCARPDGRVRADFQHSMLKEPIHVFP